MKINYLIRKTNILLLAISIMVYSCQQGAYEKDDSFMLEEGDLLFQDLDCGPLCEAIEKVTIGYKGARFSHIGIVAKDANSKFIVIEAMVDGVVATPLESFLGRSFDSQGRPKVVVGRLNENLRHLIPAAIKHGFALKGKPYDEVFAIHNDAYYCSELIYEIFLKANHNKPVFKLEPMTFKDPDTGVILPAWQQYFSELNVPIPEGRPGINPASISRSPNLAIVYAFGRPTGWQEK